MKLIEIFDELLEGEFPIGDSFKINPIPFYPNHKIGLDKNGGVSLLLKAHGDSTTQIISRRLKHFEILYNKECKIIFEGDLENDSIQEKYSILTLKLLERDIQDYFLGLCENLLNKIGNAPNLNQLESELEKILTLFKFFSNPPLSTIQGLFGELLIIHQSEDPEYLLKAWHLEGNNTYDFDDGIECLEIKTTSKQKRIHSFSRKQLQQVDNKNIFVGSIIVTRSDFGITIFELMNAIRLQISDKELIFKLDRLVFQTIGEDIELVSEMKFDLVQSSSSVLFYSSNVIPTISDLNIPEEVSNVKFDVNLEKVEPTTHESKLLAHDKNRA